MTDKNLTEWVDLQGRAAPTMNNAKNLTEWVDLFNKATPAELVGVATILLQRIESRIDEVYNLCKANPKHLRALPVDKLQEVAFIAGQEAHAFFASALPNALDMLYAFEGVTLFTSLDLESKSTASELTEVITDIETVWKEAGGKRDEDLLTWRANIADIPLEKVSARARREMDSRRHSKADSAAPAKGKKRKKAVIPSARVSTETKG